MPHPFPPRREPRVLAAASTPHGLAFAVVDAWHVRAAGSIRCRARSRGLALLRVVRREKPTALVAQGPAMRPLVRRLAQKLDLGHVEGDLPALPPDIARELYPELSRLAPSPRLSFVAARAISAVLHAPHLPRRYAPRLHPAPRRAA